LGHLRGALGALLGHSWGLPGSPCGTFGALLGGLGVFLGLPDRHHENICWLIDFYDDFGARIRELLGALGSILGCSWGFLVPLGSILAASGRALGCLCGSLTCSGCNMLHMYHNQKNCLFLEREHEIHSWLLVCLLGALGSLSEALGTLLEHLRGILAVSWEPYWSLGGPEGENCHFSSVLQGSGKPPTPALLPEAQRAGAVEGGRGRHKSLPHRV
jgi:hypothetical protein